MTKKTKKVEVVDPQEVPVVETPVVETPTPKKVEPKKPTWEIKDRAYYLKGGYKPVSRSIKAANIYYFDEKKVLKENLSIVKTNKLALLMK